MALTFDVAVVGGGIAGVSAALASQLRGAQTCLVRAAPGATALSSGAWTGPLRGELREQLAATGFPILAVQSDLPHERGHRVRTEFAGASHAAETHENPGAACGFAGLPHFNAQTLARIWNPDAPLRAHTIDLAVTPSGGWSTASLAAYIERAPDELISHLKALDVTRAIFPAVLGIERVADVIARLAGAGIVAVEALAGTPSIPGWRLQIACDKLLAARGVKVFNARARLGSASGRRVERIAMGDDFLTARTFVLATGKYLAGGIAANEEFEETVLGLPVWLEQLGDVFTSPAPLTLTDPVRTADQLLMHAGVHTDDLQRPIDRARDVIYENVFVAGTVRSGWQAAEAGLGRCAEDGWSAGERASA